VLKLFKFGKQLELDYEQPPPGFENISINENSMGDGCFLKTLEHEMPPWKKGNSGCEKGEGEQKA